LRLTTTGGEQGAVNRAFSGAYLKRKTKYHVSLYVRSYEYKGKAEAGFYRGGVPIAVKKFSLRADGRWKKYEFTLTPKFDADGAEFAFCLFGAGTVHLDAVSVLPDDAISGCFRRDAVQLLKEFKPCALRFPSIGGEYPWKQSVGDRLRRKYFVSNDGKGHSLGVGFFEYFRLAQTVGALAYPVVDVNLGDGSVEERVENAAQEITDVLDFAVGSASTVWGGVREEMGSSAPFALAALGVTSESGEELRRLFPLIEEKIREIYPTPLVCEAGNAGETDPFLSGEVIKAGESVSAEKHTAYFTLRGEGDVLSDATLLCNIERDLAARYAFYSPALLRGSEKGALLVCDARSAFTGARFEIAKIFSFLRGDEVIFAEAEGEACLSATARGDELYIKIVNLSDEEFSVEAEGEFDFGTLVQILQISPETESAMRSVAPLEARIATVAPRSFTALVFRKSSAA